jgi:hypothetical protein
MIFPDYKKILQEENLSSVDAVHHFFKTVIMYDWSDVYREESRLFGDVTHQNFYNFTFGYDHVMNNDFASRSCLPDSRVIFAFGVTDNVVNKENRKLIRNFWGSASETFGYLDQEYDKGHFIAHVSGGPIDINIFPQRRDINRGWSVEGKRYRAMEKHISKHPGTFVFSRPLYNDFSCCPAFIEFGYYDTHGVFEIAVFPNK